MSHGTIMNRRAFVGGGLAAAASLAAMNRMAFANAPAKGKNKICAFIKFVQALPYEELAERIAEMGFDGIEATVRDGGHVLPERVEDDLPKLVEALSKHNLEITVMASSVNRVDQPHAEKVLRTAATLGVKKYRLKYFTYDLMQSIPPQLAEIRSALKDLVAMNRELGLSGVYQNHSGARNFGATIWDLHSLIKDYPVSDIGIAFDIRHATVEGGLSWPLYFQLMRTHLGAVYVKDFVWEGLQPENVPLGKGRIDAKFFGMLRQAEFAGPVSLHVEYLPKAGVPANLKALQTDLATLRQLLAA